MKPSTQKRLLAIVRRNYNNSAEDFSRSRQNLVWPETERLIKEALSRQQPGNRKLDNRATEVLDLGCGNGRLLDVLKEYDVNYTGIEQSSTLADYARKKIKAEKIAHAHVVTEDIVALFTKENLQSAIPALPAGRCNLQFSLILLIAVLPHVPSRQLRIDVLRGIRQHLADNGRLIITCWNLRAHPKHKHTVRKHAILKLIGKNKMEFGDVVFPGFNNKTPRYYHAFTKRGLRKELKMAGFLVEELYED